MKATTISSIMLAVAVLVTGCHKAEDKDGMGPAQEAGKAIDDLCDRFGRSYGQETKNQVKVVMERAHGKVSRRDEVMLLRSMGVPEPGVLDYLSNEIHRNSLHKRNGPQNPDEVRLFAARQLLQIGPESPPPAPRPTPASPTARSRPAPARRGH